RPVDVHLLLADRQGLQCTVPGVAGPLHPFAPLPGAECAGELGEGEDALAVIPPQFLLAHAPQEADVVSFLRLRAAPLPELADRAVAVEDKAWPPPSRLEPLP